MSLGALLHHHIQEGGWGMYPLFVVLALVVVLAVERACALWLAERDSGIAERVAQHVHQSEGLEHALRAAHASRGVLARAVASVLFASLEPKNDLDIHAAHARSVARAWLTKRTEALRSAASLATLFGLLGTATGASVCAYGCVANADAHSRATMLAKGMSEALYCTAFGLATTVVALVAHALLTARTERLVAHLDASIAEVVTALRDTRGLRFHGAQLRVPEAYRGETE